MSAANVSAARATATYRVVAGAGGLQPAEEAALRLPEIATCKHARQHQKFTHQNRVRIDTAEGDACQRIERDPMEVLPSEHHKSALQLGTEGPNRQDRAQPVSARTHCAPRRRPRRLTVRCLKTRERYSAEKCPLPEPEEREREIHAKRCHPYLRAMRKHHVQ